MGWNTQITLRGMTLTPIESVRITRYLAILERHFGRTPGPGIELTASASGAPKQIDLSLRVHSPLGATLVSHQSADTAVLAVRLAVEDIERQFERQQAKRHGQPSYGVPSRRRPTWDEPIVES